VVPGKPDLIHAVVESDDSILRNDLPNVVNNALWGHRPAVFLVAVADVAQNAFAQAQQRTAVVQSAFDAIREEFQARPDIADHFTLREVDPLDISLRLADVDDLGPLRTHDEERLLDRFRADRDNEIGPVNSFMHI